MPVVPLNKLGKAVSAGYAHQKSFRRSRLKLLKQYVGRLYDPSQSRGAKAEPISLVYQAVTTLVPNLVYNDPKVKITSQFIQYREYADLLAMATNHLIEEIDLRYSLRMAIVDSIFLCGWIKTGIASSGQTIDVYGMDLDPGQPYAERVDPDDMVYDPNARDLEEVAWIGNRVRITRELALESGMYDEKLLQKAMSRDRDKQEMAMSAAGIGKKDSSTNPQDIVDYVDLTEVWVPQDNIIVTIPWTTDDPGQTEPLAVVDYEGPERGPFHQLGYAYVPDQIMPAAPAMMWYDLHQLANRIARKAGRQAEREKSVLAYESDSWEDAQDIIDASDGEAVRVDNIDGVKEVAYGGMSDSGLEAVQWAKGNFHEAAMGLDQLSGQDSGEDTATQAQILDANASVRLDDMRSQVYHFAAGIGEDLMFFLHTDPLIELPLVKRVDGQEQQVFYTPEMQEGDWLDYHVKVIPYSMARQDPNTRLRRFMEFTSNVIPSLVQAAMQLGPAFRLENALNIVGRELGIDELDEFIDVAALNQRMEYLSRLLEAGVPMTQEVVQNAFNPESLVLGATQPPEEGAAGGTGSRPQQPNPMGNLAAGITPDVERRQRAQSVAGEAQRTYTANQGY